MGLGRIAVGPASPAYCDQVIDKALNRNVLQHGNAQKAVSTVTASCVPQVLKTAESMACDTEAGCGSPRRCLRAGDLAAAPPESEKVGQVTDFAAGVFCLTAVFIPHD